VDGTGLGLAIAKWIADAHHAVLSVASTEGEGSTFSVVFPLSR
jgi:signal transduction histidine kinase